MALPSKCPDCGAVIKLSWDVEEGDIVHCRGCGVALEVADVDPVELVLAPEGYDDAYEELFEAPLEQPMEAWG